MNVIKEFTVMLVDDDMPSMGNDIKEIKRYLKEEKNIETVNFLEVHVQDDTYKQTIDDHLKKHIDVILTDNSMINQDDGLQLAKNIRDRFILIDILLYSAKEITNEDYRDLSHYTQIQTYHEKKISEVTKDLIDRNLAKWDDVVFLRGIVISESIEIELRMNEILMKFFEIPEEKKISFENLILGNFSVSLEAKKQEIQEVLKQAGLAELWGEISNKIKNLQEDRNKLAHGKVDPTDPTKFILGKTDKTFDKNKLITIFSNIKEIEKNLSDIERALEKKTPQDTASEEQTEIKPVQ